MNFNRTGFGRLGDGRCRLAFLAGTLMLVCRPWAVSAAATVIVETNWVEQSITNVVELRIPKNVFVTEFHTNSFDQFTTNVVTIYRTNHTTKFQTNEVAVDLVRTNFVNVRATNWTNKYVTNNTILSVARPNSVDVYRTNWIGKTMTNDFLVNRYRTNAVDVFHTNFVTKNLTNVILVDLLHTNVIDSFVTNSTIKYLTNEIAVHLVRTNVIDQYHTNWATKTLTNEIAVKLVRTNVLDLYRTNWTTQQLTNEVVVNLVRTNLHTVMLTNWQTVATARTNWINPPVANVAQNDSATVPKARPTAAVESTTQVGSAGLAASLSGEELAIEASRAPHPSANNQYQITLRLKWGSPAPNQIQHWWIEREDGAYLSVSQDREFRRELPPGNYRVEAKVQHDQDSLVQTLRGTVVVTARDVVVRLKPSGKKLATNN